MKASSLSLALSFALVALVAGATPPLTISSATIAGRDADSPVRIGVHSGSHGRSGLGVGLRLDDGVPLQTGIWGGGGAIIGSVAGPIGTILGASAGALVGVVVGTFVVPRQRATDRRPD